MNTLNQMQSQTVVKALRHAGYVSTGSGDYTHHSKPTLHWCMGTGPALCDTPTREFVAQALGLMSAPLNAYRA